MDVQVKDLAAQFLAHTNLGLALIRLSRFASWN
eukprot:SAG31_NODE_11351_length_1040_cov_0.924548_1_plen_32_part_10